MLLTAADPVAERPSLSGEEARAIRRAVIVAAAAAPPARGAWPGTISVTALVLVMIVAGILSGLKLTPADTWADSAGAAASQDDERRQLQFATPGGTRVIWTLDPDFELQGSTP
jgi:hypothetical protein